LRTLEVCFSPAMLPYYDLEGKVVVVIDVFRASSTICVALANGVKEIIPVRDIEEARGYRDKGFLVAAERHGEMVDGFILGNSPLSFVGEQFSGQSVVLTTSNCTQAIHDVKEAHSIYIGSFGNLDLIAAHLLSMKEDVLLLCAGWRNKYNMEDTIFAGALIDILMPHFQMECDAALTSWHLYNMAKGNISEFLKSSSHAQRLRHLRIGADIEYCLTPNIAEVVPLFNGYSIMPV